jgi:sarcosine oxidase/L-pipecolate oxidase
MRANEVRRRWPTYCGETENWKMYLARSAAWVEARTALSRMASAARAKGVRYVSGEVGHVQRLIFDAAGTCTGAPVAAGEVQSVDHMILAAGAVAGSLLDMER